jgi:YqaJ-like recombinase protein
MGNVTGSKGKEVIRHVGVTDKNALIREILGVKQLNAKVKAEQSFLELNAMSGLELFKMNGIELPNNAARIKYKQTRVAERLTGMPSDPDPFTTKAMLWGQTNERLAIAKYQLVTGNQVDEAFFLLHPELRCGASPDGNITDCVTGEMGVLEAKCLNSDNHLYEIMQKQEVPEDYIVQVQMEMWMSNTDFCDFVGYDSRLPGKLDIFIKRVKRDNDFIDNVLEPEIRAFLEEVDKDENYFRMMARKGFPFDINEFRGITADAV